MPHNGLNYDGRRGGTRHSSRRDNYRVPFTGLVNGAVTHNGWPAAATESEPAGTGNGAERPCVVNGDVDHWYKAKSAKAAPPSTHGKQGGIASAGNPRGISGKGPAGRHVAASAWNSEQMAPQIIPSATAKNQWRRRTFRREKRNMATSTKNPPLPLMPPQEEEDWENEIQEVTLTHSENNCDNIQPYGPQDVIHLSFRDLTLQQRDAVDLPVTDSYNPAVHHRCPVRWSCHNVSAEQDQYADADE
ncbi:uncharacterized protein LOC130189859 [Pseudoliparis swirei]|uniref:uncharacterized protein LOC130189859 n=1 Tax=Pseudoliparis swirei TaxID=2059687 RepID=UPI0024BE915A|nr:uncharacterized protein LOC130189859 [Pseudoliparis swirei]XP_056264826.1 uncharacterized protein LOC130189859 [Pseudoliparis swirei]